MYENVRGALHFNKREHFNIFSVYYISLTYKVEDHS